MYGNRGLVAVLSFVFFFGFSGIQKEVTADSLFKVGHYTTKTTRLSYEVAKGEGFLDPNEFAFYPVDDFVQQGAGLLDGSYQAVDGLATSFLKPCLTYDKDGKLVDSECAIMAVNSYANYDLVFRQEALTHGVVGNSLAVWSCDSGIFTTRLLEIIFEKDANGNKIPVTCGKRTATAGAITHLPLGGSGKRLKTVESGDANIVGTIVPFPVGENKLAANLFRIDIRNFGKIFERYPETVITVNASCLKNTACAQKARKLVEGLTKAWSLLASKNADDQNRVLPYLRSVFKLGEGSPLFFETRERVRASFSLEQMTKDEFLKWAKIHTNGMIEENILKKMYRPDF